MQCKMSLCTIMTKFLPRPRRGELTWGLQDPAETQEVGQDAPQAEVVAGTMEANAEGGAPGTPCTASSEAQSILSMIMRSSEDTKVTCLARHACYEMYVDLLDHACCSATRVGVFPSILVYMHACMRMHTCTHAHGHPTHLFEQVDLWSWELPEGAPCKFTILTYKDKRGLPSNYGVRRLRDAAGEPLPLKEWKQVVSIASQKAPAKVLEQLARLVPGFCWSAEFQWSTVRLWKQAMLTKITSL